MSGDIRKEPCVYPLADDDEEEKSCGSSFAATPPDPCPFFLFPMDLELFLLAAKQLFISNSRLR